MSRLPLRDIAEKLTSAPDAEGVAHHLLTYLEALQPDWRASLSLRDPGRDAFVAVWRREQGQVLRRDAVVPVDQLPARFVRKYMQPSARFNGEDRRSFLARLFQSHATYEPDRLEAPALQPLAPAAMWQSAVVFTLADADDLLGVLVLASHRPRAFPSAVIEELQPLRHLAALALARRLHAAGRRTPETRAQLEQHQRMLSAQQHRMHELEHALESHEARAREESLRADRLVREAEDLRLQVASAQAVHEDFARERTALEEQTQAVGQHLAGAFAQLAETQARLGERERTLAFVRDGLMVLAGEDAGDAGTRDLVQWFGEQFEVGRVTVMRLDPEGDLRLHAARGLDPAVAARIRVPVGHGISGWVARHRRPLLVQERSPSAPVPFTALDQYNSDSFVSVPLLHAGRLVGVLNLSNKNDGERFGPADLERAELAGSLLAATLARRAAPASGGRFEVRDEPARAA